MVPRAVEELARIAGATPLTSTAAASSGRPSPPSSRRRRRHWVRAVQLGRMAASSWYYHHGHLCRHFEVAEKHHFHGFSCPAQQPRLLSTVVEKADPEPREMTIKNLFHSMHLKSLRCAEKNVNIIFLKNRLNHAVYEM